MKFNFESFPEYDSKTMTHLQYWEKVQAWVIGCKQELRKKLEGIEFVLKDSPRAPWFLGVQDMINEILGDEK